MSTPCPRCGGHARASARFCRRCGAALPAGEIDATRPEPERVSSLSAPPVNASQLLVPVGVLVAIWIVESAVLALVHRFDGPLSPSATFAVALGDALLAVAFALGERGEIARLLRFPRASARDAGRLALVVVVGALIVCGYFATLEHALSVKTMSLLERASGDAAVWLLVIDVCVLAPVFEELAFRGFILARLDRVMKARDALALQAALFAVAHMLPTMYPSHFVLGMVFGYARRATSSLWVGVALHAAWNVAVVVHDAR